MMPPQGLQQYSHQFFQQQQSQMMPPQEIQLIESEKNLKIFINMMKIVLIGCLH